jgi:hypothetical protein
MQAIDTGRHEYRMGMGTRALMFILGLVIGGAGIFVASVATAHAHIDLAILLGVLIPLAIGLWVVATGLRSRLVIDGKRIEVRSAFQEKTAELSEVEGLRIVTTRYGSY